MWAQPYRKRDVEEGPGARPLYPAMLESPQLRWAFIRKVYSIVTFQLLATVAVAAVVVYVRPIAHFFAATPAGLALYIVIIILPFIGTSGSVFFKRVPVLQFFFLALVWIDGTPCLSLHSYITVLACGFFFFNSKLLNMWR